MREALSKNLKEETKEVGVCDASALCTGCSARQDSETPDEVPDLVPTIERKGGVVRRRDSQASFWETLDQLMQLQGSRMDDQRVDFNPNLKKEADARKKSTSNPSAEETRHKIMQMLMFDGPYPMVVMPAGESYLVEGNSKLTDEIRSKVPLYVKDDEAAWEKIVIVERDQASCAYRQLFWNQHHFNYYGQDEGLGDLIISLKMDSPSRSSYPLKPNYDDIPKDESKVSDAEYHLIVRNHEFTIYKCISGACLEEEPSPLHLLKTAFPVTDIKHLTPSLSYDITDLLLNYDEHNRSTNYKFGVILQRQNQTSEDQMFNNTEENDDLTTFMDFIADRITLLGFQGFRGGLDVKSNHTGTESYYTQMEDREIMFHVSTLLPHIANDKQQLQRKRHIGNDMVCIVFQECNTPFSPDMIASHFLQVFIVVQPVDKIHYKVSVTRKSDVPVFEPPLPENGIFARDDLFHDFLLAKLINAEHACYRTRKLLEMQQRTRRTLFASLFADVQEKNQCFLEILKPDDKKKKEKEKKLRKRSHFMRGRSSGDAGVPGATEENKPAADRKAKSLGDTVLQSVGLAVPSTFVSYSNPNTPMPNHKAISSSIPNTPIPNHKSTSSSVGIPSNSHHSGSTSNPQSTFPTPTSTPTIGPRLRRVPISGAVNSVDLNANSSIKVAQEEIPSDEADTTRSGTLRAAPSPDLSVDLQEPEHNVLCAEGLKRSRSYSDVSLPSGSLGCDQTKYGGDCQLRRKSSIASNLTSTSADYSIDSNSECRESYRDEIDRLTVDNQLLQHQIEQLKLDKLHLLQQNTVNFQDITSLLKQTRV